jgi:hypothetical protein
MRDGEPECVERPILTGHTPATSSLKGDIGGKTHMHWGLKNSNEKLEELRERLDQILAKIKDIEKRLDESDAKAKSVNQPMA